eukprot:CAMPEP_0202690762 /NCGR_PEP_ID=MMETSP1385-20130828/5656_1 /ASSEMBLY_ACC=CAM_ASM_000861 /TAXON_ID=933848 /ORGANISM="Elphidium margaritaceum" /LENGTH=204 /DNA_ID=CAMNT_0049346055 /DNA_START=252 /DNA_END=865 /DNA_ORIENTATION=-
MPDISVESSSSNENKPKKKSKKKSTSTSESDATQTPPPPPSGDEHAEARIQHVEKPKGGALSTIVIIKEKTEETFSLLYIVGVMFVCVPYTFYLVFKSLFSSSGSDKIRNETFDLIKEDSRMLHMLGSDMIAKQVQQNVTFTDDSGHQRLQIIYEIQGGKGNARVDVEMLQEGKEWRMQYCIVSTQYSVIPIVDNRSLLDRPVL